MKLKTLALLRCLLIDELIQPLLTRLEEMSAKITELTSAVAALSSKVEGEVANSAALKAALECCTCCECHAQCTTCRGTSEPG
jgi:hypothetical protein